MSMRDSRSHAWPTHPQGCKPWWSGSCSCQMLKHMTLKCGHHSNTHPHTPTHTHTRTHTHTHNYTNNNLSPHPESVFFPNTAQSRQLKPWQAEKGPFTTANQWLQSKARLHFSFTRDVKRSTPITSCSCCTVPRRTNPRWRIHSDSVGEIGSRVICQRKIVVCEAETMRMAICVRSVYH